MFDLKNNKTAVFCFVALILANMFYYFLKNKDVFGRGVVLGATNFGLGLSIVFYFIEKIKVVSNSLKILSSSIIFILISIILNHANFHSNFILGLFVGYAFLVLNIVLKKKK